MAICEECGNVFESNNANDICDDCYEDFVGEYEDDLEEQDGDDKDEDE